MTSSSHQGLALLFWQANLHHTQDLATPLLMAQTAAALDLEVEIYLTAQAVKLLLPEVQQQQIGYGNEAQALAFYLNACQQAGVKFYVCSQALHNLQLNLKDLAPLHDGIQGLTSFLSRLYDPQWRGLVF